MTLAILLGGGVGSRMGKELPKQFLQLAGKEVWVHTALAFQNCPKITAIQIACHPDYLGRVRNGLAGHGLSKVTAVVAGGLERHVSAYNALISCGCGDADKVLVCDIVRPCISGEVIERVVDALDNYEACDTGVQVRETLFEVQDGIIVNVPDRRRYVSGQGPEGFHFGSLYASMRSYMRENGSGATNISGILKRYHPDLVVGLVEGSEDNIKITVPGDLLWAEACLAQKQA